MNKFWYYLARLLALVMVGFSAMFILEGVSPTFSWQDSVSHLLLAGVVLGATIVSWKWPKIGGWVFVAISLLPLSAVRNGDWEGILIGAVPFVAGIIFLVEGFYGREK